MLLMLIVLGVVLLFVRIVVRVLRARTRNVGHSYDEGTYTGCYKVIHTCYVPP